MSEWNVWFFEPSLASSVWLILSAAALVVVSVSENFFVSCGPVSNR